ncbi:MAG: Wzz/FepE/Etk N-terminal domain-containing protein [Planctomycetota bacterium]
MEMYELFRLLRRRKWLIAAVLLATGVGHFLVSHARPVRFESSALVNVNARDSAAWNPGDLQAVELYSSFSVETLRQLVRAPSFPKEVFRVLEEQGSRLLLGQWRSENFMLFPTSERDRLEVRYAALEAGTAQPLLDASIEALRRSSQQWFMASVAEGRNRLVGRIAHEEGVVSDAKLRFVAALKTAQLTLNGQGIAEFEASTRDNITSLVRKRDDAFARVNALQRELDQFKVPGGERLQLLRRVEGTPLHAVIQNESVNLVRAELHFSAQQHRNTPKHPEYQAAKRDLEAQEKIYEGFFDAESPIYDHVETALATFVNQQDQDQSRAAADLLANEQLLASTQALLEQERTVLEKLAASGPELRHLESERLAAREHVTRLEQALHQIDLFSGLAPQVVRIFQPSTVEQRAEKQFAKLLPLIAALATLLSIGAVYAVEFLDHRIHDEHTLRRSSNLPILGQIPVYPKGADLTVGASRNASSRVTQTIDVMSPILKRIHSQLDGRKVLLVTGPDAGAGKSFVALHLAACSAALGKRTLLIDADLHQPQVHQHLGIPQYPGLFERLKGTHHNRRLALEVALFMATGASGLRVRPNELPLPGKDGIAVAPQPTLGAGVGHFTRDPNLHVIPCGSCTKDSAPLFESPELTEFLAEIRPAYDLIVIDSPPIGVIADSMLLSGSADGTVLVLRAGISTDHDYHCVRQTLAEIGAPLLGTVLNGARQRPVGDYRYARRRGDARG